MIKENKPVYLCGFMGCGKTTVGKLLASRLKCDFYDLDEYIESKEGMTIPEIFQTGGEQTFRRKESSALMDFKGKSGVIATGGGTLVSEENARAANSFGVTVFIDSDFELCYSRIKNDPRRPIAFNSTKEQLFKRFSDRYPLYKAHSRIVCPGDGSPADIAGKILELLKTDN